VLTDVQNSTIGHFIYECKGTRPYLSRPSRTQQLENPRLLAKLKSDGKPSVEVPEEFKQLSVIPTFQIAHSNFTPSCTVLVLQTRFLKPGRKSDPKKRKPKIKIHHPKGKGPNGLFALPVRPAPKLSHGSQVPFYI
jgi:hypothetical protein